MLVGLHLPLCCEIQNYFSVLELVKRLLCSRSTQGSVETEWLLNHCAFYFQISGKIFTLIFLGTFSNSTSDAETYQTKITAAACTAFTHHVIFHANWKDCLLKHKQDQQID